MKVIKRYKLVEYSTHSTDGIEYVDLEILPDNTYTLYDSEYDAIKAAYNFNEHLQYAIIPIISFDNY